MLRPTLYLILYIFGIVQAGNVSWEANLKSWSNRNLRRRLGPKPVVRPPAKSSSSSSSTSSSSSHYSTYSSPPPSSSASYVRNVPHQRRSSAHHHQSVPELPPPLIREFDQLIGEVQYLIQRIEEAFPHRTTATRSHDQLLEGLQMMKKHFSGQENHEIRLMLNKIPRAPKAEAFIPYSMDSEEKMIFFFDKLNKVLDDMKVKSRMGDQRGWLEMRTAYEANTGFYLQHLRDYVMKKFFPSFPDTARPVGVRKELDPLTPETVNSYLEQHYYRGDDTPAYWGEEVSNWSRSDSSRSSSTRAYTRSYSDLSSD